MFTQRVAQQRSQRARLRNCATGMLACLVALAVGTARADEITGTLEFTKRPPRVGVLYVPNGERHGQTLILDQLNKTFTHSLLVGGPDDQVQFKNSDGFEHNIYARDPKLGIEFDVGLMDTGSLVWKSIDWPSGSLLRIGCKIHPTMWAYIANIESGTYQPFQFERDRKEYPVRMTAVPAGGRQVVLLLAGYDPLHVAVPADGEAKVAITRNGKLRGTLRLRRSGS